MIYSSSDHSNSRRKKRPKQEWRSRQKGPARFAPHELLALDGDAGARKGPGTSVDGLASLRHWPSTLHSREQREGSGRGAQRGKRGSE